MELCVDRAHVKRAAAAIAVLALHFCLLLAMQCSEVGAQLAKPRLTLHLDGNARNKTQHERLEPSMQAVSQLQQVPPEIPAGISGETVQAAPSGLASGVPDDLLAQLLQTLPSVLNESSLSSNARAAPVVSEDVLARLQQVATALLAGLSGETDKAVPSGLASGDPDNLLTSGEPDDLLAQLQQTLPSVLNESSSSSNARAAPVVPEDVLARLQDSAPALLAGLSGEADKAVPSELASGVSDDLFVSASLDRATNETAEAVPSFSRESGKEIGEGLSGFRKVMQKFEHFRKRQ